MADLTITAANIETSIVGASVRQVQIGETGGVGQIVPLYRSTTDNKYYPGDADNTSAEAEVECISLTTCSAADEYVTAIFSGKFIPGATLAVGTTYVVSPNEGKIAPDTDLTTGDYVSQLGVASTTTVLDLLFNATGIQKA